MPVGRAMLGKTGEAATPDDEGLGAGATPLEATWRLNGRANPDGRANPVGRLRPAGRVKAGRLKPGS